MDRCIVFTDFDLDGAGSYLAYKWLTNDKNAEVIPLKVSNLREKLLSWLGNNSFENYDKIYFFDLDTTTIGDLIDKPNVYIFDHHETHTYEYKQANTEIVVTTSCTKLILNKLNKNKSKLSVEQLRLLSYIDDYDSYTLKFKESYQLNILFWYYNSNRLQFFAERFENGFNGFTNQENNLINSYNRKFEDYSKKLKLYSATIPIKDKEYKFISTFADKYINDVAHYILQNNKDICDVLLLINANNKRVYLRNQKDCDLNLGAFAEKLCDGGGHRYAAGGKLTDSIKTLSKEFQPI